LKLLFIGHTIAWDTMAAALGYLELPLDHNNWYGNNQLEKQGGAIPVGTDNRGREVYVLGSTRPQLIKKVVGELLKVGYPSAEPVEVIILKMPRQKALRYLVLLTGLPIIGGLIRRYTYKWSQPWSGMWWQQGYQMSGAGNRGCEQS